MNLVLLDEADFETEHEVVLRGRRARHIREVHRAAIGETLAVGREGGTLGRGTVLVSSSDSVRLQVALDRDPPPPSGIELMVALPRPKVLRRLLQTVTTLGVKRLVLVNAWRVEKSYFDSPLLRPEAIEEEVRLGLEQAKDTVAPQVQIRRLLMPFLEQEADEIWPSSVHRLVADPRADAGIEQGALEGHVVLAIGPEGGWIDRELDALNARGFTPVGLGPRILKVETAVTLAVGQLQLARKLAERSHGLTANRG